MIFERPIRGTRHILASVCLLAVVSACGCGDASIDDVRWSCASDRECGTGQRCSLGLCVGSEGPGATRGLVCELAASETRESAASFSIEGEGSRRTLVFATGGREGRFALPAEVVSLDSGPLEGCCISPCCALSPP